jgi:SRSO17 transposase
MAARLAPANVRGMHQSLHHLVADAPWNDDEMLAQVRRPVLPRDSNSLKTSIDLIYQFK